MLKKICNTLLAILLILLVAVAALLLTPRLMGYETYAVLSGSMEPKFHVGSVVLVKDVPAEEIQVGDAITFRLKNGTIVTHQVVEVDNEAEEFTTKGIANETNDHEPVSFQSLLGRAEHSIPLVGYVSIGIKSSKGIALAVILVLVIIILAFLPDVVQKSKSRKATPAELDTKKPDGQTSEPENK